MTDEQTKLERLGREVEVLESRLLCDVDALARRELGHVVEARPRSLAAIAIGAAAVAFAWITVHVIARSRRARSRPLREQLGFARAR